MGVEGASEPFLERHERESEDFDDESYQLKRDERQEERKSRRRRCMWPLIHLTLIAFYTLAFLFALGRNMSAKPLNDGPLRDLDLGYEKRVYANLSGNPFWGEPSDKLEKAWDDLMDGINIRVTGEELAQSRQKSVEFPGGGHLAWLTMHHNIHCLRHVHKYTYRDIYAPNRTQHQEEHMKLHMDHCLEMMRQDSLCKVDTTLKTFEWLPDKDEPVFIIKEPVRTCVDWKAVVASTKNRQVSDEEVEKLQNPLK